MSHRLKRGTEKLSKHSQTSGKPFRKCLNLFCCIPQRSASPDITVVEDVLYPTIPETIWEPALAQGEFQPEERVSPTGLHTKSKLTVSRRNQSSFKGLYEIKDSDSKPFSLTRSLYEEECRKNLMKELLSRKNTEIPASLRLNTDCQSSSLSASHNQFHSSLFLKTEESKVPNSDQPIVDKTSSSSEELEINFPQSQVLQNVSEKSVKTASHPDKTRSSKEPEENPLIKTKSSKEPEEKPLIPSQSTLPQEQEELLQTESHVTSSIRESETSLLPPPKLQVSEKSLKTESVHDLPKSNIEIMGCVGSKKSPPPTAPPPPPLPSVPTQKPCLKQPKVEEHAKPHVTDSSLNPPPPIPPKPKKPVEANQPFKSDASSTSDREKSESSLPPPPSPSPSFLERILPSRSGSKHSSRLSPPLPPPPPPESRINETGKPPGTSSAHSSTQLEKESASSEKPPERPSPPVSTPGPPPKKTVSSTRPSSTSLPKKGLSPDGSQTKLRQASSNTKFPPPPPPYTKDK